MEASPTPEEGAFPPGPGATRTRAELLAGWKDSASVGLGLFPMGLAFGTLVTHNGLPWWTAPLYSGLLYTGTLEFLLVPLVLAEASLFTIALTALLVNGRHAFYALSFPLHRVRGRLGKAYSTFALSDEAYAMATRSRARTWSSARMLALQASMHLYCVAGSLVGSFIGVLLPDSIAGLEFAMVALLVVLALDAVKDRRHDVATPVLALAAVLIARLAFPDNVLLVAFGLLTAALLAQHLFSRKKSGHA